MDCKCGRFKTNGIAYQLFLDYAYDTKKWNEKNLLQYYTQWAAQQFGKIYAQEIGAILEKYAQISARRKPELLNENTFALYTYDEFNTVSNELLSLERDAVAINSKIAAQYKDAYFQLVLHPVKALSNLYQLYYHVALNKWAANYHQANANKLADKAKQFYINDSLISVEYNHLNNGKWNHMMDQTHIGYTYWQQPEKNKMPEIKYLLKDSIESEITIIKGRDFTAEKLIPANKKGNIFFEQNGYVSANAEKFSAINNTKNIEWKIIPNIGRNNSGICVFPVNAATVSISANTPHVEYEIYTYDSGAVKINTYFSPTLNIHNTDGLKCAVSVDDEQPVIINIHEGMNETTWRKWVADNIIIKTTNHTISKPGKHIIKYWMIDSGIILQKIVADFGKLQPSYLGPNETRFTN